MAISRFEDQIHEAILLACEDMPSADRLLESIREEATASNDRAALLACLKVLSVTAAVTHGAGDRWASICRELVLLDPDNPSNHIQLGSAEEASGHKTEAVVAYRNALTLARDSEMEHLVLSSLERLEKTPPE